jgi:hypothetical protein
MTGRHRLKSVGGAERTRYGTEFLSTHRDPDDRYRSDNSDRKDNADPPDQAPLPPITASAGPVSRQGSRQGSPFVAMPV